MFAHNLLNVEGSCPFLPQANSINNAFLNDHERRITTKSHQHHRADNALIDHSICTVTPPRIFRYSFLFLFIYLFILFVFLSCFFFFCQAEAILFSFSVLFYF